MFGAKVPGNPAPLMHSASEHTHTMWTKHTILEQFNVTATEVYTQINFYQNTSAVYSPFGSDGWCYASAFPGWVINSCVGYITDGNPNYVEKETLGDYCWVSCTVDYVQRAEAYAGTGGHS